MAALGIDPKRGAKGRYRLARQGLQRQRDAEVILRPRPVLRMVDFAEDPYRSDGARRAIHTARSSSGRPRSRITICCVPAAVRGISPKCPACICGSPRRTKLWAIAPERCGLYMNASEAFLNLKSVDSAADALSRARPHVSFGAAVDQRRLEAMGKRVSAGA